VTVSNAGPEFTDGRFTLTVSNERGATEKILPRSMMDDPQMLAFMARQLYEELTGEQVISRVGEIVAPMSRLIARDDVPSEYDQHRASLDDSEPCSHYYRTDWLDENTCGCGERVF
jgi:hypothetical protein